MSMYNTVLINKILIFYSNVIRCIVPNFLLTPQSTNVLIFLFTEKNGNKVVTEKKTSPNRRKQPPRQPLYEPPIDRGE